MVRHLRTARLDLRAPEADDVAGLFEICGDPRVWTHFPSLRHTRAATTAAMLERWERVWDRDGIGTWVVRREGESRIIGYGGCSLLQGAVWNLGYRIGADEQGRGYATEVARAAIGAARGVDAARAVVAYLLEHNTGSAAVARKVGLHLVDRGPDVGNPDPEAVRLVFADRPLSAAELAAVRS